LASSQQTQGYSVSITNICGSLTARETIQILSVTLTANAFPIAVQTPIPATALQTGETATYQFSTSQFPQLATTTPNDVTVVWRRGQEQITTTFFPILVGVAQDKLCLRVLLTSGIGGGDASAVFSQVSTLASGLGSLFGVAVNVGEAKSFKFGDAPIVMAPVQSFDFSALGMIGVGGFGGPLGSLPPSSYKMSVGTDSSGGLMLSFVDQFNNTRLTVPGTVQLLGPGGATTVTDISAVRNLLSSRCGESLAAKQSVDPCFFTIGLSLVFKPLPTIVPCLGFTCGPIFDFVFLSFSFCIDP